MSRVTPSPIPKYKTARQSARKQEKKLSRQFARKPEKKTNIGERQFLHLNKNELAACDCYRKQLSEHLHMDNSKFEHELKTMKPEHWKYSSILRHHTMRSLALNLFMDTTNTIVVVFKIKDVTHDERDVIYNITYVNIKPNKTTDIYFDKDVTSNIFLDTTTHGNLYVNNICPVGSTFSKDGEYRSVLIYWKFVKYFIGANPELLGLFKEIVDYFTDKFQDRKLIIYAYYYFPTDSLRKKYSFELELMITNRKLEYFSLSWFMFFYSYTYGTVSDHLNQTYQKIMLKYKHEDGEFFKSIIDKYSIDTINYLYHIFNTNIRSTTDRGIDAFCKAKLGQKLIPISLREIQYPFDMTYKPWKEYFINLRLTDLVVNNITPGFPIVTNWLFIKNIDEHIFDNPMQYSRLEKSMSATQITNLLSQARYLASEEIKPSHILLSENDSNMEYMMIKKNKRYLSSWLSKEFQMLYDGINEDIKTAQLNIIMSNVTFCIFSEFVGKTLYESVYLTKKSSYYKSLVSDLFSENGFTTFERYMFEIAYNLYCAASKFGIVHGDLHLHNITINDLFYKVWTHIDVESPHVLYVLDPGYEYVFETNFYYMTLIDFSRSIIDPNYIQLFKHHQLHKTFDIVDNMKDFESIQMKNLLDYLYSCKPEYKEHAPILMAGIKSNFPTYLKVLSILDLYMIMLRLSDFLQHRQEFSFTPYSGSVNLVKKIFMECDLYLTDAIRILLTGDLHQFEKIHQDEWPIFTVIKRIYSHRLITNSKVKSEEIVDIYNYNNPVKYSLNDTKDFPPSFNELKKNKDNDNFIRNSIKRKESYDAQSLDNYKTLLIIKKRQREKNIL